MFGTNPPFSGKSLAHYLFYDPSVAELKVNTETDEFLHASSAEVISDVKHLLQNVIQTAVLFCIVEPCAYHPFPMRDIGSVLIFSFAVAYPRTTFHV